MSSFKDAAYKILKEAGKPLHCDEITRIALKRKWLHSKGKTPGQTMQAELSKDLKQGKSRFVRLSPAVYGINKNYKEATSRVRKSEKKLEESFVKNSIIKWLSANGWGYFHFGEAHEHGVDIQAKHTRYPRYFFIETKGQGQIRQSGEVAFIYSLGQIITRMKTVKTSRNCYGLGLPEAVARIALRRVPWQAANKLGVCILAVDESGDVKHYSWKEMKAAQTIQ